MTVHLYGADLFGSAVGSSVVRHLNNAPGGEDGVDVDAQYRLGAKGAAAILDRRHGICCGITVAWIIGVCHRREEAVNASLFSDYFRDVLRFQGAGAKDKMGNPSTIGDIDDIQPHGLSEASGGKCTIAELPQSLPSTTSWASYLGVWHHAIGAGRSSFSTFHIMDPNAGLFIYSNSTAFERDLEQLCDARRVGKGKAIDSKLRYHNYQW